MGISIGGANGPLGTVQTIYTRGASAANTLILMDGVPLYDASGISSEFDLLSFASGQIERIEILKGAQSTLYGSDAVAGVVNIITKKSAVKPVVVDANFSAGSYNTYRAGLSVSGSTKKSFDYYAGYSKIYSDGFSSAYDSTGTKGFDKDGFKQDAFNFSLGFKPLKKLSARLYGKYNSNRADIDAGAFTDDKDYYYQTKNSNAGTAFKYQLKNAAVYFNYNYNWYDRTYTDDSADVGSFAIYQKGKYRGRSHFAELYTNIHLNKDVDVVSGVAYNTNATTQSYFLISGFGTYNPPDLGDDSAHTSQFSAYASVLYNDQKGFNAGIGGRWNRHSVYGSNATFSVNPSYSFSNIKLFANISSAFRVPSLYQLYGEYGNAALKPERIISYEAGAQYNKNDFTARGVVFEREIKDVFVFYTDPSTYLSKYINEDRQKDKGVELELFITALKNKLSVSANYTYVEGKIFTKDFAGKDTSFPNLYRRPKNIFNFNAAFQVCSKVLVSTHLRSTSSLLEPKYNAAPEKIAGHYTLDLYGEYRFIKSWKFFADCKNITGQTYSDQQGFNTRKFNVTIGFNTSF